jgi:16S rRNA (guanine966-N2)-methyltransferase
MELPEGLRESGRRLDGQFDLIYADPPYEFDEYRALLEGVESKLQQDGRITVEHSNRTTLPREVAGLVRIQSRSYGETSLSVYARRQDIE